MSSYEPYRVVEDAPWGFRLERYFGGLTEAERFLHQLREDRPGSEARLEEHKNHGTYQALLDR